MTNVVLEFKNPNLAKKFYDKLQICLDANGGTVKTSVLVEDCDEVTKILSVKKISTNSIMITQSDEYEPILEPWNEFLKNLSDYVTLYFNFINKQNESVTNDREGKYFTLRYTIEYSFPDFIEYLYTDHLESLRDEIEFHRYEDALAWVNEILAEEFDELDEAVECLNDYLLEETYNDNYYCYFRDQEIIEFHLG